MKALIDFLKVTDDKIYRRYVTVERNIKAASNSFYDSYLDLLEEFLKVVAAEFDISLEMRETCGGILKKSCIHSLFTEKFGLDEYTYGKMQDYTLKVNGHKHKNEKLVSEEIVNKYMNVFLRSVSAFASYKGLSSCGPDEFDFSGIFGEYHKENSILKKEMTELRRELGEAVEAHRLKQSDVDLYKNLLSQAEIEKLNLDEQNYELQKQISKLKDIKLSSMEEKLNKTIELLHELTAQVVENRAISYAVGDTICGRKLFESYVERAKGDLKHER